MSQSVWTPDEAQAIARHANSLPFPSAHNGPGRPFAPASPAWGLDDVQLAGIQKARAVSQGLLSPGNATPDGIMFNPITEAGRQWTNPYKIPANLLTFPTLRELGRVDVIRAIIGVRIAQCCEWAQPSNQDPDGDYKYRPGFIVRPKDLGNRRTLTTAQSKRAAEISTFLRFAGVPGSRPTGAPRTLERLFRLLLRDSLMLDAGAVEKVRTRGGRLAYLLPLDASTIRYAQLSPEDLADGQRDPREGYVQINPTSGEVVAHFDARDLIYLIRNPSTDLWRANYGEPELEILVATITTLLNSETYNASNFTNGLQAAGILGVISNMNGAQFDAWQRKLYMMLNGPSAINRMAAIQLNPATKDDVKHIPLGNTNKEMQYQEWIQYVIKKICMTFGMDPAEIGLVHGNEGQESSLNSADPATRIAASRERGLFPLVRLLFETLQAEVVEELDPDFEVAPQGLVPDDRDKAGSRVKTAGESWLTINEVRAAQGREPLEDADGKPSPLGALIMNAAFINAVQQAQAMQAQADQGEPPEGAPDDEGDNAEPDDEGDNDFDNGTQQGDKPSRADQGPDSDEPQVDENNDFDIDALFAASPLGSLSKPKASPKAKPRPAR